MDHRIPLLCTRPLSSIATHTASSTGADLAIWRIDGFDAMQSVAEYRDLWMGGIGRISVDVTIPQGVVGSKARKSRGHAFVTFKKVVTSSQLQGCSYVR